MFEKLAEYVTLNYKGAAISERKDGESVVSDKSHEVKETCREIIIWEGDTS